MYEAKRWNLHAAYYRKRENRANEQYDIIWSRWLQWSKIVGDLKAELEALEGAAVYQHGNGISYESWSSQAIAASVNKETKQPPTVQYQHSGVAFGLV